METYTISEEKYNDIITKIQNPHSFNPDGCLCGEFTHQLEENFYLSIGRSCRKANTTPSGQQWIIDEIALKEVHYDSDLAGEKWEYFIVSDRLQLNEEQANHLLKLSELATMRYCGYNKYGEEFDEEDYKYYTDLKKAYEEDSTKIDEYVVILERDDNNELCLNDKKLSFFMNYLFNECKTIEEINWLKNELNEHVAQAHLSREYDLENV